ncbi:MAG: c-type cytochrome [Nitrospirae bacterium]|nr:c-type cytochrome [Nitrospirota bacterium]
MKKRLIICALLAASALLLDACKASEKPATAEKPKEQAAPTVQAGEKLFKQHCSLCHPDGKNIVNPQKTLFRDALEAGNVRTPEDIIHIMRNPGPGMKKFDDIAIPDKEAREIADYILKTFK